MPVYDPVFIDQGIASLYEKFGVTKDERVVVRFLTMLNAGFLLGLKYVKADIPTTKTKQWKYDLEKSGELVGELEKEYCKKVGDARMESLKSYFEDLQSGKRKCVRFSLADRDFNRKVRDKTRCSFYSEPDALETGRYYFIPLNGEEPEDVEPSGVLETVVHQMPSRRPSYPGEGVTQVWLAEEVDKPKTFSTSVYPERKDPKGLAKEAGDILGLKQELFLAGR